MGTMKYLFDYANDKGLPIVDRQSFDRLTDIYGKETFRNDLSKYIATQRPAFPLNNITKEEMRKTFFELKNKDVWDYIIPKEQLQRNVKEKYDDYKYNFKEHGLGLIDAPNIHNDVSNYFQQELRMYCSSYSYKGPLDTWYNGNEKDIWRTLGALWRGVNSSGDLSDASYREAIRLGTYIATQFKPNVAKSIYQMTNAKKVLDTSCGWGDRLAGFFTSDAEEYIGCDPNPNTYKNYMKQIEMYNSFLSKPKKVTIYRCGAENLPWEKIKDIDCAFTSPPYFATEEYNKGGDNEQDQSWYKFNEYEKWRDDFYLPVAEKSFNSLSSTGHLLVNIMDPQIKNKRYRSCDELVDRLINNFVGQIGMRIMQRPKSDKLFETEEEKKEFRDRYFIENIWCFSKDTNFDFFRHSRRATLF